MHTFKMTEAELIRELTQLEAQYRALHNRFDFPALMEARTLELSIRMIRLELEKRTLCASI